MPRLSSNQKEILEGQAREWGVLAGNTQDPDFIARCQHLAEGLAAGMLVIGETGLAGRLLEIFESTRDEQHVHRANP